MDRDSIFQSIVQVIEESEQFGPMLQMFGGSIVLAPLKEPLMQRFQQTLVDMSHDPELITQVRLQFTSGSHGEELLAKIDQIVQKRLDELTPHKVKEIIANMIREHLDWLVVWGGVFGGLIGLLTSGLAITFG